MQTQPKEKPMPTKPKKPSRSKYKPYTQEEVDRQEEKYRKHFRKKSEGSDDN